jgi:hypothetical protein
MYRVMNKEEAMNWFLSNSEGSIMCVDRKNGYEKVCDCYADAKDFFESNCD